MTTLMVDIQNEQEERVLLAFLNSLKYNYRADIQPNDLSEAQKSEVLRRESEFEAGRIKSEPWNEVKKRFLK